MLNPYVTGGVALLIMALVAGLLYERGNAIEAIAAQTHLQGELNTALDVNRHNEETIGRLRATDAIADKTTAENSAALAKILQAVIDTNTDVSELAAKNEDVRKYLDGLVPGGLLRVLNRPRRRRPARVRSRNHPGSAAGSHSAGLQARHHYRRHRRPADGYARLQGRVRGPAGRHSKVSG
ncbi:hypothetical protein HB778_30520 [Mesorhizobium huakuii]|uniref:Uncharacterized protein n=1 Tax=Mesorhizobium huakuii TaxID=28104 RepID=A0A7G6T0W7_9HYPH|nr:hypothetical protein [Mesorhizobium huakuii]QND60399.1 hypothetical protein HB778_30520 [Mesorhizobium huakuii]